MKIDPIDVAKLRDDDIKRLALMANDAAALGGPLSTFWTAFQHAAIRAMQERRRTLAWLEQGLLDEPHAIGKIVPDIATGLADALDTLDGGVR